MIEAIVLAACVVVLVSLVGLYVLLRRERSKRIAAEKLAADLEAAYQLVVSEVRDGFGVGRSVVLSSARTTRKGDVS